MITRRAPLSQRSLKQGFTMLEILVAIAIIAILLGFGFHAYNKVIISGRTNATRVTLGNLKGMLAELESQSGSINLPIAFVWVNQAGTGIISPPQAAATAPVPYAVNFWKDPFHFPNDALTTATPPGLGHYDSLIAPTVVTADSDAGMRQRFGSIAVVNTGIAMNYLNTVAANKSRLGAIPLNQTLVLEWTQGGIPMPGADRFIGYQTDQIENLSYVPGTHVRKDDKRFVAAAPFPFPGNPTPVAGSTAAPWYDETNAPNGTPILLDGWGNPIIFVPATGLRVQLLNGKDKYDPMDATQFRIVHSPEGNVQQYDPAIPNSPFMITPGRPFWASAGPDGNFATGDDNLYSFEQ